MVIRHFFRDWRRFGFGAGLPPLGARIGAEAVASLDMRKQGINFACNYINQLIETGCTHTIPLVDLVDIARTILSDGRGA